MWPELCLINAAFVLTTTVLPTFWITERTCQLELELKKVTWYIRSSSWIFMTMQTRLCRGSTRFLRTIWPICICTNCCPYVTDLRTITYRTTLYRTREQLRESFPVFTIAVRHSIPSKHQTHHSALSYISFKEEHLFDLWHESSRQNA